MNINNNATRRRFLAATAATASTLSFPHAAGAATTSRIRIGQIGTKHPHASGKIKAIRQLDDLYEVVGVVEPDLERQREMAQTDAYRDVKWMTTEELLNTESLAAVAVETDVRDLVASAMICVKAGKHIHLDKPAGPSMSACRELHAEAGRQGVTIQMGYMLRYNPAFERLFQMVQNGWLGRITEITAMMGKKGSDSMRRQLEEFTGGGMFELSCHIIDAMVTVLGKPDKVTAHNRRSYPDKDSMADNQLAVFDYPTAIATIRCNHIDPFGGPRRHFDTIGEKGAYQINPLEPPKVRLALDRQRGQFKKGFQNVPLRKTTGRYDDEFIDLAKVIRQEKELAWNSEHDLAVHEAVLLGSGMPLD
ncbi:Gfo/Idh/MocA family protein [Planctomycetes bacterium K23_9]|uniref:Putative oxidoreductase YhhX n=1 Tax=Stieleria marina TaxID=1930275 RepID=A0A517NM38_9BACT|nr:putative oxidoreductase YhhX [Planctomycetes bacterium K23_9]